MFISLAVECKSIIGKRKDHMAEASLNERLRSVATHLVKCKTPRGC